MRWQEQSAQPFTAKCGFALCPRALQTRKLCSQIARTRDRRIQLVLDRAVLHLFMWWRGYHFLSNSEALTPRQTGRYPNTPTPNSQASACRRVAIVHVGSSSQPRTLLLILGHWHKTKENLLNCPLRCMALDLCPLHFSKTSCENWTSTMCCFTDCFHLEKCTSTF